MVGILNGLGRIGGRPCLFVADLGGKGEAAERGAARGAAGVEEALEAAAEDRVGISGSALPTNNTSRVGTRVTTDRVHNELRKWAA